MNYEKKLKVFRHDCLSSNCNRPTITDELYISAGYSDWLHIHIGFCRIDVKIDILKE